jgi:hypothetical protein
MTEARFEPAEMLRVLGRHKVRYVVIGGFAAIYHGAAHVTFDLDVTPERSEENLTLLSAALAELGAEIRTEAVDGSLPFSHDAQSLARVNVWNLRTPHGDLDVTFVPAGTGGYEDLHADAKQADLLGITVEVASLADVVRSKEAAGRPKDLAALPTLRRLLDEQTSR